VWFENLTCSCPYFIFLKDSGKLRFSICQKLARQKSPLVGSDRSISEMLPKVYGTGIFSSITLKNRTVKNDCLLEVARY
jgi:hypothetical protein